MTALLPLFTLAQATSDSLTGGGAAPVAGTTAAPGTSPVGQTGTTQGPGMFGPLMFITLFMVVIIFFQIMGARREKKKRETLLSALKKGDKVLTIGGQIGTVDQVKDTEVILRVDENSNARARFTRSAIQQIIESSAGSGEPTGTIEVKAKNESPAMAR